MKYEIVVIGASLGGLHALRGVLSGLGADFPCPVAIVQHRKADSDDALEFLLQRDCRLLVCEAQDKSPILAGKVYIAPSRYHLLIENSHFILSMDKPENHAQPSIDVLFESAVAAYGARTIGVVLSGTGMDGAKGLAAIARCGGIALVESPQTAYASGMPQAAIDATQSAKTMALQDIAPYLINLVNQ